MAESDADSTYEELRARELRQLAFLAGEFRDALMAARIPTDAANDLLCAWFDDELSGGEGAYDDDD